MQSPICAEPCTRFSWRTSTVNQWRGTIACNAGLPSMILFILFFGTFIIKSRLLHMCQIQFSLKCVPKANFFPMQDSLKLSRIAFEACAVGSGWWSVFLFFLFQWSAANWPKPKKFRLPVITDVLSPMKAANHNPRRCAREEAYERRMQREIFEPITAQKCTRLKTTLIYEPFKCYYFILFHQILKVWLLNTWLAVLSFDLYPKAVYL